MILGSFLTLARIPPTLARSLRVMSLRRIVRSLPRRPEQSANPWDPGVGGTPGGPRDPRGPWGPLGVGHSEWMGSDTLTQSFPRGRPFWEGAQNSPKSTPSARGLQEHFALTATGQATNLQNSSPPVKQFKAQFMEITRGRL